MDSGERSGDEDDWERSQIPDADEIMDGIESISLTPTEHQRIKDLLNGERLNRIKRFDRRYLVVGAGGDTAAAERRMIVYDLLDERTDPPAIATRLEDFGLTPEDIRLWGRVFDILCGEATHIVGVLEDFDGGYVWELGLLFAPEYRQKVWILKRAYESEQEERRRYENGMAASHVELLLTGEQSVEWVDVEDLKAATNKIP
ncbi:hypothetical protein [Halobaculum magnesiiphilum]|uniref:hypothetical protein n=1 Tax=Halobaculum magnesiiphilum TaxID=1017351 RepID=UPI001CEC193B|nr:hypothetical protein [Halobaculum magnesiiphilum]